MNDPTREPAPPVAAAIIVAAGRGVRAGAGLPKQFRDLGGQSVLARTVAAFDAHPAIGEIVVVRNAADAELYAASGVASAKPLRDVEGGDTRDASVRAGLAAVSGALPFVLIHDAARPLVRREVIDGVLAALSSHEGAAPALAVTDALWRGAATVTGTEARDGLWRAQTPQGFHLGAIRAAHAAHADRGGAAADDVEVARAGGLAVAITPGDENNIKITAPGDFARAARIVEEDRTTMDIRTGNGFDVHRFGPGDHVMLCGVKVPHERGLQGHSDADVGLHTLTDAIYGALAEGDIGTHFPPSDPQWKGAASHVFMTHAVNIATDRGFAITHADVTLICERPKVGPHAAAMRAELARLLRIEEGRVSVKATTTERLGFTGREEGIAALATVTLVKR
ncbi:bifunctional 2-C-methyl-D-erythritol 4-phosphate cytidylyltransferase/2-C-methyl-D-erythritol 2,4-cyclodiphosphate synthase [Roseibacterium sp. SDUM158017]|uniref:bifunctional 2-C-methyl-D-erythritol 4-phosphate cytidylyltransferase/2-C-methyl-D-erythritol 2,4-cyclodiphosphate synthase n=1 Tax=Roseicyclus salinarum TaxID=3036773 RepID=UPI0024151D11|nr:bifunctional 2-C-methyl-D-erythritol 4-phosphate cytidylyltransferase/2-C-methyl-D-erythritol 2,4-cyclodiphosphate synthase [Roseibacterium sp. SDUM158017]MDG4648793.1 bifunctional 2-C-methyl-D-erythritol 4-phosphate cytidylyltransferase/2-C-methyl-D-erythritol 2,4-cyclodiphosphate synthase [Roseibacterium sp. SDUM158017]